jgi:hypothetical protein
MPVSGIRIEQLDVVASEFEGSGTDSRSLSLKGGAVTEEKLGFSWKVVEIAASAFSYSATRSTYTLSTAASSNASVLDFAELLRNGVGGLTRVTTTAAAGEWSLSGTTLSVHGDITGNGATYQLRYVVGTASGAASSSGNQIWLGTVPQVPLQTETDYFQSSSLALKWTDFDNDGRMTYALDANGITLTETTGGDSITGLYQTAPAYTRYAITAQVSYKGWIANYANLGVFVAEDISGSPTTAGLVTATTGYQNGANNHNLDSWTDYNTHSTQHGTLTDYAQQNGYVRLFVDTVAQTYTMLISPDGDSWAVVDDATYAASQVPADPQYIGMMLNNNGTGADVNFISRMFRVDETDDPFLSVGAFVGTSVAASFDERKDVAVVGNDTVNIYGWAARRTKLIKVEAFSAVPASVGAYTMAVAKDPAGTPVNQLSASTFDMTGLSAFTPAEVTLASSEDDRTFEEGDVWRVQFVSDNSGLNAEGVYYQLTWLVL